MAAGLQSGMSDSLGSGPVSRRSFVAAAAAIPLLTLRTSAQDDAEENAPQGLEEDAAEQPAGPVEATFQRDYPAPDFQLSWQTPQINRELAADFVIYAHTDLAMTQKLLAREPGLLNAALDWGGGDWETALGGASHMGQRETVDFLLSQGARADLFCAAMLGQLEIVRGWLTVQPSLIDARGPHGFSLHFHAQVGGDEAADVLAYLQEQKEVDLPPLPPFLRR